MLNFFLVTIQLYNFLMINYPTGVMTMTALLPHTRTYTNLFYGYEKEKYRVFLYSWSNIELFKGLNVRLVPIYQIYDSK